MNLDSKWVILWAALSTSVGSGVALADDTSKEVNNVLNCGSIYTYNAYKACLGEKNETFAQVARKDVEKYPKPKANIDGSFLPPEMLGTDKYIYDVVYKEGGRFAVGSHFWDVYALWATNFDDEYGAAVAINNANSTIWLWYSDKKDIGSTISLGAWYTYSNDDWYINTSLIWKKFNADSWYADSKSAELNVTWGTHLWGKFFWEAWVWAKTIKSDWYDRVNTATYNAWVIHKGDNMEAALRVTKDTSTAVMLTLTFTDGSWAKPSRLPNYQAMWQRSLQQQITSNMAFYDPSIVKVEASTLSISMTDQTVNDNAGAVSTDLSAPTVSWVDAWAVYSIVSDPTWGKLTINSSTWVATRSWNETAGWTIVYTITYKVTNTDGSSKTVTFTLNVVDNL